MTGTLGHIAIKTKDVEKTIKFYEKLGGEVVAREDLEDITLVMIKWFNFELEILALPEFEAIEGSIPHIAIRVDDIDGTIEKFKALGVDTFRGEKQFMPIFGGMEAAFFTGPSGEVIELMTSVNK